MRRQGTCPGITRQVMRVWIPDRMTDDCLQGWDVTPRALGSTCSRQSCLLWLQGRPRRREAKTRLGVYMWWEVGGGLHQGLGV